MNHYNILKELKHFSYNINSLLKHGFKVHKLFDYVYIVYSNTNNISSQKLHGKKVDITFGAIVHGNEQAGIAVLNNILKQLSDILLIDKIICGFYLGNIEAYKKQKRFIQQDLNRSFNSPHSNNLELKRAKHIQALLSQTKYFIDFHQTTLQSTTPFFIFPYKKESLLFARNLDPFIPVVTHWDTPYSSDGCCSDEYVNLNHGVGITVELGQAGFDYYQIALGTQLAINALRFTKAILEQKKIKSNLNSNLYTNIFKVYEVIKEPFKNSIKLKDGFYNFYKIKKGELIGTTKKNKLIKSKINGYILFPKYKSKDSSKNKSTEVCRILKRLSRKELPSK